MSTTVRTDPFPGLHTIEEAAEELGVSWYTVYGYMRYHHIFAMNSTDSGWLINLDHLEDLRRHEAADRYRRPEKAEWR